MSPDWLLSLIPATLLVFLAVGLRRAQGSWLVPGPFFAAAWSVFVWVPIILARYVPVWPLAVFWILFSAAAVAGGSWLGIAMAVGSSTAFRSERLGVRWPGLPLLVIALSVLGLAVVPVLLHSVGRGLDVFLSFKALSQMGSDFYIASVAHSYREPMLARVLMVAIYLGAWFGGLLLGNARSWIYRLVAFLPLFSGSAVAIVLTTRAAVLYPLVLIGGGYVAARVGQPGNLFNRRQGLVAVGILSLLLIFGVLLSAVRSGYSQPSQIAGLVDPFRLDALGYLGVFSSWLHHGQTGHVTLGQYSFAGIFELLGLKARSPGLYPQIFLGDTGRLSNLSTIFRGLIQDFGLIGSTLLLAAVGWFAGFAYARVRDGNLIFISVLAAFYATVLLSFIVNLFTYNSLLVAWLLFCVYFVAVSIRSRKSRRSKAPSELNSGTRGLERSANRSVS